MDSNLEGVYWNIGENEYNVQISFPKEKEDFIISRFQDWMFIGEGDDPKQKRKIVIFRKKFLNNQELQNTIQEIKNNTILLKEVS